MKFPKSKLYVPREKPHLAVTVLFPFLPANHVVPLGAGARDSSFSLSNQEGPMKKFPR